MVPFWRATAEHKGIDWAGLEKIITLGVKFLNRVVDKTIAPLEKINEITRQSRKIGLGIMGLGDALSALCTPYSSLEGRSVARDIVHFITSTAEKVSEEYGFNNSNVTLVAPNGTTSTVADVSSGVEPLFRVSYTRESLKVGKFNVLARSLNDFAADILDDQDRVALLKYLEDNNGKFGVKDLSLKVKLPRPLHEIWQTADQISPIDHLRMAADVQSKVTNGVSKTINLGNSATREEIKALIPIAWKAGLKGLTVYRDGSREVQVLTEVGAKNPPEIETPSCTTCQSSDKCKVTARPRSDMTYGETVKVKTGCGNLYVTTNADEEGICEAFTNLGRSGGCASQSEATTRLISLALRSGINVDEVAEQLKGIRCMSAISRKERGILPDGQMILSCPDAIGKCLSIFSKKHIKSAPKEEAKVTTHLPPQEMLCPVCGASMQKQGGCKSCPACGYSKCG